MSLSVDAYVEKLKGLINRRAGKKVQAARRRLSKRAIAAYPNAAELWALRGHVLTMERVNIDRIEECYRRSLSLDKKNTNAMIGMAFVHDIQNRLGMAERLLTKARRLEDSAAITAFLAQTVALRGRKMEAVQLLKRSRFHSHPLVKDQMKCLSKGWI